MQAELLLWFLGILILLTEFENHLLEVLDILLGLVVGLARCLQALHCFFVVLGNVALLVEPLCQFLLRQYLIQLIFSDTEQVQLKIIQPPMW